MRIVVTDANIFFDLIGIGTLDAFFQLGYEVHTTVLVMDECDPEDLAALQVFVDGGTLHTRTFDETEMKEVEATGKRKGLRPPDRSILYHAKAVAGIVLTGDGAARKECAEMNLECHGILWCIAELHQNGHFDKVQCMTLLDTLEAINKWLPRVEMEKMRRELGGNPS